MKKQNEQMIQKTIKKQRTDDRTDTTTTDDRKKAAEKRAYNRLTETEKRVADNLKGKEKRDYFRKKDFERHKLEVEKPFIVDTEGRANKRSTKAVLQAQKHAKELQKIKDKAALERTKIIHGADEDGTGKLSDLDKKLVDQDGKKNIKVYDSHQKNLNNTTNIKLRSGDNASILKDLSDSGIINMPYEARQTLFRPLMDLAGGINPDKDGTVSITDVKGFLGRLEKWKQEKTAKLKSIVSKNPGQSGRILKAVDKIEQRMTRIAAKLNRRLRSEKEGLGRMAFPDEIREIRDIMHPGKTNNELMSQGILEIRSNGHMLNEYIRNVDNLQNSLPNNKRLSDLTKSQKKKMITQLLPGLTSNVNLGKTLLGVVKKAQGDTAKNSLVPPIKGQSREVEGLGLKINEDGTVNPRIEHADGTVTPAKNIEELVQIKKMVDGYHSMFTDPENPSAKTLKSLSHLKKFMEVWSKPGKIFSTTAI